MESKKKKTKLSPRKGKAEIDTSDSDVTFSEDDPDDQDYQVDQDDLDDQDDEDLLSDEDIISSDSSSDSSSDNDSDIDGELNKNELDFDWVANVVKLLDDHGDVNIENSIIINRNLQETLEELRNKIISMIKKCRDIYEENQHKLENPSSKVSALKGIGSLGKPFFKDKNGKHCPPNFDYTYRSQVETEFFPIDLEYYPHFLWTPRDKVGILQGIKEQAIEYIERKDSYKKKSTDLSKKVKLHTLKLNRLLELVDDEFEIDWNQISIYNLNSRHTANSCLASWNAYLKPEINRDAWTVEENAKLHELAKKYKFQDWIGIASELPGRTDYQCFVQYQTVVSVQMQKQKGERWTKEEDELLLSLIEENRMGNVIRWNPICSQLPNRTKTQCFTRWKYSIDPHISRAPFTSQEDCIILAAVEEYGENFNCFPRDLLPNRTVVQIRSRYLNSIKPRGKIRHWSPEDDELLLELVGKYGEHDWKSIENEIKAHTRSSCRTRYLTITKYFEKNPNATIKDIPRKKRKPRSNVSKHNWVQTITGCIDETPVKLEKLDNESYRSKLRSHQLQWYNFLKYSYDYRFGEGYSRVPNSVMSLEFVRHALECELRLPISLKSSYSKGFVAVTLTRLVRLCEQEDKTLVFERPDIGYKLPPSYCTLLAFRGLCIQASLVNNQDKETRIIDPPADVIEARKKFKLRLMSLLYKTTLLSRLEPVTSVEHNKFEVIIDASTELGRATNINLAEMKLAQMNAIAENLRITQEKAKRKEYEMKKMNRNKCNDSAPNTETTKEVIEVKISKELKNVNFKEVMSKIAKNLLIAQEKAKSKRTETSTANDVLENDSSPQSIRIVAPSVLLNIDKSCPQSSHKSSESEDSMDEEKPLSKYITRKRTSPEGFEEEPFESHESKRIKIEEEEE